MRNDGLMRLTSEVLELRAGLRRLEASEPPINVAAGKTLKVEHSMTLTGADGRVLTIPATGTAALLGTANVFTDEQTIELPTGNTSLKGFTLSRSGGYAKLVNGTGNSTNFLPFFIGLASYDASGIGFEGRLYNSSSTSAAIVFQSSTSAGGAIPSTSIAMGFNNYSTRLMTILGSGNVGIGNTAPSALLHLDQSSTTAAKPTLRLRQADLSEEFIRFESTVGTGNAINTTALGAYYGRVRVWVEGVGAKWLALYD